MDYAIKWENAGYKSGFFNKLTNIHIGRLTNEINNKNILNAYDLNNEEQFVKKNEINEETFIKIINLEKRTDRKLNIVNLMKKQNIDKYEFINAVDGDTIDDNTQYLELFYKNDFANRRGFFGCALSHFLLWKRLLDDKKNNFYLILEDDVKLSDNFYKHIENNQNNMNNNDLIFFGYLMYNNERNKVKHIYDIENSTINIEKLNNNLFIGGTHCYSINKLGARKMINYMEINGIKHGIDYVMGKKMHDICYESQPHIAFAEWNESNDVIDTDIQTNYKTIDLNNIFKNILDEFVFVKNKDQQNFDIYRHQANIISSMKLALTDEKIVAFNTLGFFKNKIENLIESMYFTNINDGIYIKKKYYEIYNSLNTQKKYNVKILNEWKNSNDISNEFSNMLNPISDNIQLTSSNNDNEVDYYVIINKPNSDKNNEFYNPKKTIIFQMEPWVYDDDKTWGVKTWGEWSCPDEKEFLYVGTHKKDLNAVQWQITIPTNFENNRKNKLMSILSEKNYDEGHIKRINFIKELENNTNDILIDIYGRENYHKLNNYISSVKDEKKENIFSEYKYCLSVENNSEYNYATEKIWEPILCECLCFYWGCPNLEDYIDNNAFVRLDITNINSSIDIIKKAIEENWWEQRIECIRREKTKILNKLGFFPKLQSIIMSK